jgi:choline dehydrogenase
MPDHVQHADIIIVGAGTAGCVLANRLALGQTGHILVLESGGSDRHPLIAAPGGVWWLMRTGAHSFRYQTAPQPHLDGRSFHITRGRVLGGSSSTNGMVYSRGAAADYARWSEEGLPDWSYEEVLDSFRRLESHPLGPSDLHGASGPIHITRPGIRHPLSKALMAAAQQAGFPLNEDTDGSAREGFGPIDLMTRRHRRCSTAAAYLQPVLSRDNLQVQKRAHAVRILFEGRTARGVAFVRNGRPAQALARQVILCGGAIETPHLLMLSGIGPQAALRAVNLPVVHDLAGVGQGLQDHLAITLKVAISQPITLRRYRSRWRQAQAFAQYLVQKRGPLADPGFEITGFVKSHPKLSEPDLRLQMVLALVGADKRGMLPLHGFQIRASLARPTSRGSVRLASADPFTAPIIDPQFLSGESERHALRHAVRIMRQLWTAPAFDPFRGRELAPGPHCSSDEEIDRYVRGHADPDYHSVGTCRMGEGSTAVVDSQFRVHGIEGLRVVDASIMPSIVDAGTCVPTIMIAERAADQILKSRSD